MLLIGRRHIRSNNSWMHNVEVLVKGKERCTLQVHPLDAEADAFYRRFGFEPAPHDARQLLLLLKDARRVAGASK